MSTNQPGKPRVRIIEDADTEGHALKFRPEDESVNRDIDATEGHLARSGRLEDADTEGHAARGKAVEPAGDDEDTEGHPFKR